MEVDRQYRRIGLTEPQGIRHRLYPEGRPGRLARLANRSQGVLAAAGLGPKRLVALEVRGRHTGRPVSVALVVADLAGVRYLVSMLGDGSSWVRNLRAANGVGVLRHRGRQSVYLVEVPARDRAPILRRYLECAPGARPHIPVDRRASLDQFAAVADRFPVFRIEDRAR